MTRKKSETERLGVNILVPFSGSMAEEVKSISQANGLHTTQIVRMIMEMGLKELRNGRELKLVVPKGSQG